MFTTAGHVFSVSKDVGTEGGNVIKSDCEAASFSPLTFEKDCLCRMTCINSHHLEGQGTRVGGWHICCHFPPGAERLAQVRPRTRN